MTLVAEDLGKLSPKQLGRRLEELWMESLKCVAIVPWDASPSTGLTVGLWVETGGRRDVADLGRVAASEPGGISTVAWSLLEPSRSHSECRLMLHVDLERPVHCSFVVGLSVRTDPSDELKARLPLLLAADVFAFAFDGFPDTDRPLLQVLAPAATGPVAQVFALA